MKPRWTAILTPTFPASYIKNEYQKLDIYKRISGIESEEEYMDMQDELIDASERYRGRWKICCGWLP